MIKTLSSKAAAQLDVELMSTGAFSIDQLMELAGLAVALAIFQKYPPSPVLVLVGSGNNGGDGLVAARHLKLWGYGPILYYPKKSTRIPIYQNLLKQCSDLNIDEVDLDQAKSLVGSKIPLVLDSLFGFLFKPPIREPFGELISFLATELVPVVSVDIPSGWDVDLGPPNGDFISPEMLVSLTAPKPCAKHFKGKYHYLGGRFINDEIAQKYGITDLISLYKGNDLVVKL